MRCNIVLIFGLAVMSAIMFANFVQAGDCTANLLKLVSLCAESLEISVPQKEPSPLCCYAVEEVDVPCVCRLITPEIEEIISVKKVAYVAEKCKHPLHSGSKCGSFTVPKGVREMQFKIGL